MAQVIRNKVLLRPQDVMYLLSNAIFFFMLGYSLLHVFDEYEHFQGFFTVINAMIHFGVATFLFIFYTDVFGLNPATAGLVLLTARFSDGISDLVIKLFLVNKRLILYVNKELYFFVTFYLRIIWLNNIFNFFIYDLVILL